MISKWLICINVLKVGKFFIFLNSKREFYWTKSRKLDFNNSLSIFFNYKKINNIKK